MHAQTGEAMFKSRALYIVDQLAECQAAGGDGYVAGFTRKGENGDIESGRAAMEEQARLWVRKGRRTKL